MLHVGRAAERAHVENSAMCFRSVRRGRRLRKRGALPQRQYRREL